MSEKRRLKRLLAPTTQALYSRILTRAFGDAEPPFQIPKDVANWTEGCKALLHSACKRRYAEVGLDSDDILEEIPVEWQAKRVVEIPSEEEMAAYETVAREQPLGRRALALIPLAMGLRAMEVITIPRHNAERAARYGELIVLRKGGEERRLPAKSARKLFSELLDVPRFRRNALDESPLTRRQAKWGTIGEILSAGTRISQYHVFHRLIQHVGRKARIAGLHPHKLRHAFCTRMLRDGAPLPVIQWMLGHANIATTLIYAHPTQMDAEKYLRDF